jgi:GT2 family glycosyltransferase
MCVRRNLIQVAEQKPSAGFLQPKILFLDNQGVINSAGNDIHFAGFGVCRGISTRDIGQYDRIRKIGYASGACVMVSREALNAIGPLDEIFFAYGEDKDWGWRAKMLGYDSMYVPTAKVYHKWSAVLGRSPRKMYYLELERLISISKNHSKRIIILLAPILLLVEFAVLIHALARGWLREKIMAYAHVFALRAEIKSRRKELLSKAKIPDSLLIRGFVYDLQHPYVGRLTRPLNFLCTLYSRLLI